MSIVLKKLRILILILVATLVLVGCEKMPIEEPKPDPVLDVTNPVISGANDISHYIGEVAPDFLDGISASDDADGDITAAITVDYTAVDLDVEGTYTIIYTVTDEAGNETTETINVIVSIRELTGEEKAALDVLELNFDPGFNLPISGENGTSFFWRSTNRQVITNAGLVIQPPIGSDQITVTLIAMVVNGDYTGEESFDIIVNPRVESVVTSRTTLPFEGTSEEYIVLDQAAVDIFYVDNGTVPHVDIETFLNLIDGAIDSTILNFFNPSPDVLVIEYEMTFEDFDGMLVTETYTATINFTDNTFTVNTFDFFDSYVQATTTDFGGGLVYVDAHFVDSKEVTIPLGDYRFDLVIHEEAGVTYHLMSLHVANLLFLGGIYYDVYYNGDELFGIDSFAIMGNDPEDLALQERIRESSFNDLDAAPDLKEATYHFLALALDFFFGLREDRGIESYYSFLSGFADRIITETDFVLYRTIFNIAHRLDDLHTSHAFTGFHESATHGIGLSINDVGANVRRWYDGLWAAQDLLKARFGTIKDYTDMGYRLIDNEKTAVIHLTGFNVDTPPEMYAILSALPATVENVVFDLSYNTGGNLGAVLRLFGYMTEQDIIFHSQNPADDAAVTWYIQSDYVAFDYNWFIMTSSVTFSAANLMASMAQEMGVATIIGQKSSGGASSIGVIITPDGSGLIISTNNVLSRRVEIEPGVFEYISIEKGVDVDFVVRDFTNDQEIIDAINDSQQPIE